MLSGTSRNVSLANYPMKTFIVSSVVLLLLILPIMPLIKQNSTHNIYIYIHTHTHTHTHRVFRGECARLRENVPYIKVHRYNLKHLHQKLNGYGDNGERKVWSSCGSTYCTCFACCYPYIAYVRLSVSQLSQEHSDFIINRCHSYSEL